MKNFRILFLLLFTLPLMLKAQDYSQTQLDSMVDVNIINATLQNKITPAKHGGVLKAMNATLSSKLKYKNSASNLPSTGNSGFLNSIVTVTSSKQKYLVDGSGNAYGIPGDITVTTTGTGSPTFNPVTGVLNIPPSSSSAGKASVGFGAIKVDSTNSSYPNKYLISLNQNSVEQGHLQNGAVNNDKLADSSVNNQKIENGSVNGAKLSKAGAYNQGDHYRFNASTNEMLMGATSYNDLTNKPTINAVLGSQILVNKTGNDYTIDYIQCDTCYTTAINSKASTSVLEDSLTAHRNNINYDRLQDSIAFVSKQGQIDNLNSVTAMKWGITGNYGTNYSNFLGTVDNVSLRFRVANKQAGIIDTLGNLSIGGQTGGYFNNKLYVQDDINTIVPYSRKQALGVASNVVINADNNVSYRAIEGFVSVSGTGNYSNGVIGLRTGYTFSGTGSMSQGIGMYLYCKNTGIVSNSYGIKNNLYSDGVGRSERTVMSENTFIANSSEPQDVVYGVIAACSNSGSGTIRNFYGFHSKTLGYVENIDTSYAYYTDKTYNNTLGKIRYAFYNESNAKIYSVGNIETAQNITAKSVITFDFVYNTDADADADVSLPSGGTYRLLATGRVIYRKP